MRTFLINGLLILAGTAGATAAGQDSPSGRAIPVLLRDLHGANDVRRYEAIESLAALGPSAKGALPDLRKTLSDSDVMARILAASALHRIEPQNAAVIQRAVGVLTLAIKDKNLQVRSEAEAALAEIGRPAVSALNDAIRDPDPDVRRSAASALGRIGAPAEDAVPELIPLLDDQSAAVRAEAARALGRIGTAAREAIPALIGRLSDPDSVVRAEAAGALGRFGPAAKQAASALAETLAENHNACCCAAACALERLKAGAAPAAPALVKALGHEDPTTRAHVMCALTNLGEQVVPLLVEALQDPQSRGWALLVLSEMGSSAKSAVPALLDMLATKDPDTRREVLLSLGNMGSPSDEVVSAMVRHLGDADQSVRQAAAYGLGNAGSAAAPAVARLAAGMRSDDALLSILCARALARIAPHDKQTQTAAVSHIRDRLTHGDPPVRLAAIRALGDLRESAANAAAALVPALKQGERSAVKASASEMLVEFGEAAVPALAHAVKDERTRLGALVVLGRMGPAARDAVPEVLHALKDREPRVRHAAIICLGEIGPAAKDAVPAIEGALADPHPAVRRAAGIALKNIGEAESGQ